jgi:hypothetical protein
VIWNGIVDLISCLIGMRLQLPLGSNDILLLKSLVVIGAIRMQQPPDSEPHKLSR